MADPSLEEIAAGLYAGPPEDFIRSRNALADKVDDAELARVIRRFRKPSIAAWVVNVFAQERAEQMGQAVQLAADLREAQNEMDAPALTRLSRERRTLTRRLAETAAELAGARGERITPATLLAVEQSISAAFFDSDAAAAVASGRLVRALEPSAHRDDIHDAVAGPVLSLEVSPERPTDELQARRVRRDAERRVSVAEKELAAGERDLSTQDKELRALQRMEKELSATEAALEAQLAAVRAEATQTRLDLPEAEQKRATAADTADAAEAEVANARRALGALP